MRERLESLLLSLRIAKEEKAFRSFESYHHAAESLCRFAGRTRCGPAVSLPKVSRNAGARVRTAMPNRSVPR